jgi:chromosome segregation ATPase
VLISIFVSACDTQEKTASTQIIPDQSDPRILSNEADSSSLHDEVSALQTQLTQTEDQLSQQQQTRLDQKNKLEAQEWENTQLIQKSNHLKNENQDLQAELKAAQAEIVELDQALSQINKNCDLDKL